MIPDQHHVVLLGASHKPDRYAHQAQRLLLSLGYRVTPVNPALREVLGVPVLPRIADIREPADTLTLYLGAARLEPLIPQIVELRPGRVIFNPGTESAALQQALDLADIPWFAACTLVMLQTGQF